MIINDDEALKRLSSPMNLINRLRQSNNGNKKNSAMSLFGIGRKSEEVMPSAHNELPVSTLSNENGVSAITGVQHPVKNTEFFNPFQNRELTAPETSQQVQQIPSSQIPYSQVSPQIPESQPVLNDILENHESQIKLGLAHDKALDLLHRSVDILNNRLDEVRADKLPSVISAASKTVESIRRERNEASKNNRDREVRYHFYTPSQKQISDYEVIDVQ